MEVRRAASSWEDVENLGNFKRPSLPESTPAGTEDDPKVEGSVTRTAVAVLNIQTGIKSDLPLPLEQICTFFFWVFFFIIPNLLSSIE